MMSIWRITMVNRRIRKPTHPGELIRKDLLPETNLTQTQLADLLGVSRRTVCEIAHERRRVTPDLAIRLAKVFNSTPEMWLNMQQAHDLWEAQTNQGHKYAKIRPVQEVAAFLTV
jgi:antitoxin HigA-1